jgi:hypothetical protein
VITTIRMTQLNQGRERPGAAWVNESRFEFTRETGSNTVSLYVERPYVLRAALLMLDNDLRWTGDGKGPITLGDPILDSLVEESSGVWRIRVERRYVG